MSLNKIILGCFLLINININVFSQVFVDSILNLNEIEQDHPLLEDPSFKHYFSFDLNKLLTISEKNEKKIGEIFNTLDYYLRIDTCLSLDTKQKLLNSIETLKSSYVEFIAAASTIEYLSYGKGHQAGYRSLIFKIIFQDKFYDYLKYWSSTFYFVYIEK